MRTRARVVKKLLFGCALLAAASPAAVGAAIPGCFWAPGYGGLFCNSGNDMWVCVEPGYCTVQCDGLKVVEVTCQ